jgi:hypothetical protein
MSSNKKRNNDGQSGGVNSKKANTGPDSGLDFLSDGLDNKAIREVVQDIMSVLHENKGKKHPLPHANIINNMTQDEKYKFFIDRYPMLFEMVSKEGGFDYSSFEYFLSMREEIIKKNITSEEASKQVGQVWFDKYYKKPEK